MNPIVHKIICHHEIQNGQNYIGCRLPRKITATMASQDIMVTMTK